MFCKNCGKEIDGNAVFCPHCGVAVRDLNQVTPQTTETNTLAIVGFILSFFIAIAGLVCSILGKKRADELNGNGREFAVAGIVISIVSLVSSIFFAIVYVLACLGFVGGIMNGIY